MSKNSAADVPPITRAQWQQAISDLPDVTEPGQKIPSFFFAHGNPSLIWPPSIPKPEGRMKNIFPSQGPDSPLAAFLRDLGPALVSKYHIRGIVVFSAHWETDGTTLVTDYGARNPLLYDYYNFHKKFYEATFESKGDSSVSKQVVALLEKAGIPARTTTVDETRGTDGRGFDGSGLDHGVFVPFKLMFGDSFDIPVVQVSIDGSLSPDKNWALGKALDEMRSQGILILSGGLTVHTFQDIDAWSESTATPNVRNLHQALLQAVTSDKETRRSELTGLIRHPGFRAAHPREEHFVPVYVAAGAGEDGGARIINGAYGAPTFAFGV